MQRMQIKNAIRMQIRMQINEIDLKTNNRMNSEVDIVKISISSGPDTLLRLKIWLSKGICWNVKFSKPKHHMNFLKPMSIFRYTQKTNNRMNSEDDIVKISISSDLDTLLPLKMRLSKGNSWNVKYCKLKHHMTFLKHMLIFCHAQKTLWNRLESSQLIRY